MTRALYLELLSRFERARRDRYACALRALRGPQR